MIYQKSEALYTYAAYLILANACVCKFWKMYKFCIKCKTQDLLLFLFATMTKPQLNLIVKTRDIFNLQYKEALNSRNIGDDGKTLNNLKRQRQHHRQDFSRGMLSSGGN
jgi:hypothetical protein